MIESVSLHRPIRKRCARLEMSIIRGTGIDIVVI
jgi:hypothetical protein